VPSGRPADFPIGIGLRLFDGITAELLAENFRPCCGRPDTDLEPSADVF
jgi:hypothetical protein